MFQQQTVSQKQSNNVVLSNPKQSSSSSISASSQKTTPATVEKMEVNQVTMPQLKGLFVKLKAAVKPRISSTTSVSRMKKKYHSFHMGDFYINDTALANFIDFIAMDLKD